MTVPENHNAPAGQYPSSVSFVVEKDETVGEVNTLNNPGYGMAEELISVIRKSPKWILANRNGILATYTQPQAINNEGEQ